MKLPGFKMPKTLGPVGFRHFLLALAIILLIVVFIRVIYARMSYIEGLDTQGDSAPSPETNIPNAIQDSVEDANRKCSGDYSDPQNMPLREYAIMASYNSAYDGASMSKKQLINVIARGYRWLDLNVFMGKDEKGNEDLYVGYNDDNSPTLVSNSITFSEAMRTIEANAFVNSNLRTSGETINNENAGTPTLQNNYAEYPLFVNIRVYRPEKSNVDVVAALAQHLGETAGSMYYREQNGPNSSAIKINGCTLLSDIKKKLLISMDIKNLIQIYAPTHNPTAKEIPVSVRELTNKYANIYTGGHTWRAFYRHSDIDAGATKTLRMTDTANQTNIQNMYIAYPFFTDKSNPDIRNLIFNHSIQTIPIRIYIADGELERYERIFNELKRPMVPMGFLYYNRDKDWMNKDRFRFLNV